MTTLTTEQETFWQGEFGNEYVERNRGANWLAANLSLFSKILHQMNQVNSVLELGSNIGLNLMALTRLLPEANLSAVEINERAGAELKQNLPSVDLHLASILDFEPNQQWDLVFTKGVLIHINPGKLPQVYDLMYRASSRYILVCEYYNPSPMVVPYRGHSERLFKRDFAGELMDLYRDLSLVDYGFVWRRDPNFPQDDMTWFLLEKKS